MTILYFVVSFVILFFVYVHLSAKRDAQMKKLGQIIKAIRNNALAQRQAIATESDHGQAENAQEGKIPVRGVGDNADRTDAD
jgi:hypothetical protein